MSFEILWIAMNHITGWIAELEVLHFKDRRFEHPAEERVGSFMYDDTWERQHRDHETRQEEHQFLLSFTGS
jgi:hypothetical protein